MESMGFVGRLRWVAAAPAAAALLALSGGHAVAQTPQQIQQLADQAIRRLDLQTNFPVVPEPIWIAFPPQVLWIVVGVAAAILLYTFRDLIPILRSSRGDNWISEDAIGGGGKAGSPAAALGAADEFAAQGRFVEAMHVLLLQGLAAIRAGLDEEFADSLTSREILRRARLSDPGRASLRDIVNRVEWTYFGQYPAALADYQACRASFNTLTQALHGDAPA
jgi:hypothetical protein